MRACESSPTGHVLPGADDRDRQGPAGSAGAQLNADGARRCRGPGLSTRAGCCQPGSGHPGAPRAPAPGTGRSLAKVFNTFVRTILP